MKYRSGHAGRVALNTVALAAMTVWYLVASPKARYGGPVRRPVAKVLVFGLASLLLWAIGQPLPGSVVFYPLPGPLLMQLTPAPAGYQYVRVANDILLMATGTRMIAAALADLSMM